MGMRVVAALCVWTSLVAGCGIATVAPAEVEIDAGADAARARRDGGTTPTVDAGHDGSRDVGMDASSSVCTVACTTDSTCAAACGAVPGGGIRCCDLATTRCFVAHTAACPAVSGYDAGHDANLHRADTNDDAAVDAPCPPSGALGSTEIAISAPGLAGAEVSIHSYYGAPASATLDASGRGVFRGPELAIGVYYGDLSLLDTIGLPISFEIREGTATATVYPTCVAPDPGSLEPLDRVDILLQRDRATGLCAGTVLSVVAECVPITGTYTASMFDDLPCGPFR